MEPERGSAEQEIGLRKIIRIDEGAVGRQWDAVVFVGLLVIVNLPLFWGGDTDRWAFSADKINAGEWWRLLTHPFAHVSWYHLLLDAGVFLPLYGDLGHRRRCFRLLCVLISGTGALLGAMIFSNDISTAGMRGSSGIAYGLMAVWAVEMLLDGQQDRAIRTVGAALLGFVLFTIAWEHATGSHFLAFLLFDMVGTPVIGCHLGGVVGALVVCFIVRIDSLHRSIT